VRSSRMLKKLANIVLASLRGSEALEDIFRSPRSILWANGYTKCGRYLLASSLAAALLGTRRVSARQGWAGETSSLLSILLMQYVPACFYGVESGFVAGDASRRFLKNF
jgi:hypothetical protein